MKPPALCAMIFLAASVHAEPAVRVIGLADRPAQSTALHVFGGRAVQLSVEVRAAEPARRVNVQASLYQLAGAIAAPVLKDLPVARELAFDASSVRDLPLTVALPEVRQPAPMELRFTTQSDGAATWSHAGSARLVVYPSDLLARTRALLAAASAQAGLKLVVLGESANLRAALHLAQIVFDEAVAAAPVSAEPRLLYLSEGPREAARTLVDRTPPTARLLLFTSDHALPPGVYWTHRGDGFIAKITLPVLADFEHTPERQWLLLTLLQQALQTSPNQP